MTTSADDTPRDMLGDFDFDRMQVEHLALLRTHDLSSSQVATAAGASRLAVNLAVVGVVNLGR
jgi:hypothetical protein